MSKLKSKIFEIPNKYDINFFKDTKCTMYTMKIILRHYGLKVSGKKQELADRLNSFFIVNYSILTIQKCFRGYMVRYFFKLKGKNNKKGDKYSNETDFYTMERIDEISRLEYYIYKEGSFKYVFKISSLIEYFNKKNSMNPYNRNKFPSNMIKKVREMSILNNILRILPENKDEEMILSEEIKIRQKSIDLFQDINLLGNYSDFMWFLNLGRGGTYRFIRELEDIWNYRSQISDEVKKEIYPPTGNPFINEEIHRDLEINEIKNVALNIINKLVNTSTDNQSRSLGAIYVLSALTLVSFNAAVSLPWLYESVAL